ncbi:DEAD/DEAH box helicase [Granulicella tundricola]|uniref:DNA 3'-5' helicase II n=1 Tax=Granulicella tundricola (strain ATCC BAA-1859 / DSM 23138 / MP5ACTX9) TaxID=1198114 RepID=E8X7Z9_GRATM|nr:DEAD/DEAH box helicase [Granulicella tundricola]ADW71583.1 UvrD/REP helicase [Granulicella tundricola MP5ACTX9]
MNEPSLEQKAIILEKLRPLCVIACAGSGKTFTAVRRMDTICSFLPQRRDNVALLSFSNVAVDLFGKTYRDDIVTMKRTRSSQVCIETFDGFLTSKILRPHANRVMKCASLPFLLSGTESFLSNPRYQFRPKGQQFPIKVDTVEAFLHDGRTVFFGRYQKAQVELERALQTVEALGALGAYTHNLGRYWAYRVLREEPRILKALARKFSQIVIDEAQDVGSSHIAIVELLAEAGSQVTLIGDPNQAIYEFCGADGNYLKRYALRKGVLKKELTINRRSVPRIVAVANSLSKRDDSAFRSTPASHNGAYFVRYDKGEESQVIEAFEKAVLAAGLDLSRSAIVCRANERKKRLRNFGSEVGQGVTKQFAAAAMARDSAGDYQQAFRLTARAVVMLLKSPPDHLCSRMLDVSRYPEYRSLRRIVWGFTRQPESGLPSATLKTASEWHPALLVRVKALLQKLNKEYGFSEMPNIGMKLAKKQLPDLPMVQTNQQKIIVDARLRVETVHGVKGESLDAVLYMAERAHLKALLDGTGSETGRIGYVAVTRARDLFWLGILTADATLHQKELVAHSFIEVSA